MPYQTAFISYRRQSSHAEAAFIHNSLRALGVDVFYDRDDLAAGDLWEARLNEELVNRDCLIVVLAPETLQESYWVPREIQIALTQNKKIIPVFTKGFTFSDAYVPDDIAGLKRYNGIRFDYDIADYAVGQIAKVLEIKVTVNVTTPPAPVKQQNWIGRFLSSQSWQGISAIIGIIGVIIAVIALNGSSQSTANTTLMPQLSTVAVVPSATSAPTDLPTSTPSHTPTDTPIPEITTTTQPTATSALPPTFSVSVPADVNVRTGPGYSFPILINTRQGTRYDVIGKLDSSDGLWFHVELSDGQLGWIVSSVVTLLKNGEAVVASQFESVAAEIPIATSTATYTPSITPTDVPTNTATHTPQPTDTPLPTNTLTPTNPPPSNTAIPIAPPAQPSTCQATIKGTLNSTIPYVRLGPSPSARQPEIQARGGEVVSITADPVNDFGITWYRIIYNNGNSDGWISSEYLTNFSPSCPQ